MRQNQYPITGLADTRHWSVWNKNSHKKRSVIVWLWYGSVLLWFFYLINRFLLIKKYVIYLHIASLYSRKVHYLLRLWDKVSRLTYMAFSSNNAVAIDWGLKITFTYFYLTLTSLCSHIYMLFIVLWFITASLCCVYCSHPCTMFSFFSCFYDQF